MVRFATFVVFMLACSAGNCEEVGPEAIDKLRNLFPCCRIGEDQYGAGVYFAPYAAWKLKGLAATGTRAEKEAFEPFLQEMIHGFIAYSGRDGEGITLILDCAGLDTNDMLGSDVLELMMKISEKFSEFPTTVKTFFVINNELPSWIFSTILNPLLGDLASRTKFYGSNREDWEPELLGSIPQHVLLQGHGGTNPIPQKCDRQELRGTFRYPTAETISSAVLFMAQRQLKFFSGGLTGAPGDHFPITTSQKSEL